MNRATINEAMRQAREFIAAGEAALARLDEEGSQSVGYGEGWTPKAGDRFFTGCRASGELRRKSMDLTRKLADMRRYS